MATLNWIGKDAVVNHDKEVPFKLLEKVPSISVGKESKNLIIHGDNLEALKALMPFYKGKIKCIYIDPPYNTGNEKWVYNDNVNSPKIKEWLGKVVGAEGEDLSRHDKWLCMMFPRLALLRELLSNDGVIFVSIDDHEQYRMRLIMDEIFGEQNFLAKISVQSNPRGRQSETHFATVHEYVISYAKQEDLCSIGGEVLSEKQFLEYKYSEPDGRKYRLLGLRARGAESRKEDRPKMYYPIYVNPKNKKVSLKKISNDFAVVLPKKSDGSLGRWGWSKEKVEKSQKLMVAKLIAIRNEYDIFVKDYLHNTKGEAKTSKSKTLWIEKELNYQNGKNELKDLFGNPVFDYPKPTALLKKIFSLVGDQKAIYLDSFAGSGTTGHSVLQMNKDDKGKRRFILVELEKKIARRITSERVKRAIKKYSYKDGFEFCELKTPLFDEKGQINDQCSYNELATYIYFTETQTNINKKTIRDPFIGSSQDISYYLQYKGRDKNELTRSALKKMKITGKAVIYADRCLLDEDKLRAKGIVFKQIPYEIKVY